MAKPSKSFEGQREGEDVLFIFRRHIIAMRKGFYAMAIPFVIPAIPYLIFPDQLWLFWVSIGGLGFGLLLFWYHWLGWYYSIFIVTDQRVQQNSQTGLFGKSVIDLDLNKIQNISYNVPGFTGEMFGFGTIVLQTYVGDMVIDKVEHPGKIYNKLQEALHAASGGAVTQPNEKISQE